MKICIRGGHTQTAPGASASINELTEDRNVYTRVIELLQEVGNEVHDVTPPEDYAYPAELEYGIRKTNQINPEVFFSIHFNSTAGAKGSEVCVYPNTPLCNSIGSRVLNNLANLGFVNRGLKPRTDLGELCNISCPSGIIEVCFVQDPDATLYKNLGIECISRAIANGIDSRVNLKNNGGKKTMIKGIVVYKNDNEMYLANALARKLGYVAIWSGVQMDYSVLSQENIWAIGGDRGSYTGYLRDDHFISGADRDETVINFSNILSKL